MGMKKDIGQQNMRFTLVLWVILCSVSMVLMLFCSMTKTIVIADAAQGDTQSGVAESVEMPIIQTKELELKRITGNKGRFFITLPVDVKAENITMENRYWEGELRIHIQGNSAELYENCVLEGDVSTIDSGICERTADGVLLKVKMNSLLEYRSTMEGKTLVLAFYEPRELYDMIVVLDPAGGGEDTGCVSELLLGGTSAITLYEKEVTLQVARLVQKNLALEGVKVYLTRGEDVTVANRERLEFLQETEADFYIRLSVDEGDVQESYGIRGEYNARYFIPGFGNVQLADVLTKEVTIASSNRAEGLQAAGEESILNQIKIPAAEISLGYFTHPTESELLGQESYREKLATGLINAITKIYETRNKAGAEE